MELTQIYVLVGKRIRPAKARITGAGVAVIYTESGPVEIKRWYKTEQEARYAGGIKLIGNGEANE